MERAQSLNSVTGAPSRYDTFTEAVPLSLSSMAHASIPLTDGVLDGIKQVLQHTLFQCVNYARKVHAPHTWSFGDLQTSKFAWRPVKGALDVVRDLPFSLQKMNFQHQYSRNAWIYLKAAIPPDLTEAKELELLEEDNDWSQQTGILGCVRLLYASTEPLTPGEMDGTEVEDMPPCIMYKAVVEYRSLPATGNQQAVQAEELSMLSFGGSVDDDVKYGALASLYDEHAKYVLEIYSVRGKKYKFDLMDAILSDRTVPHLPSSREGDPFVKSCCVTVTDHNIQQDDDDKANINNNNDMYAITRMHLTMEGKPRKQQQEQQQRRASSMEEEGAAWHDDLPPFNYVTQGITSTFLSLNPNPPTMVTAIPSGHTLLLDPDQAGNIYVNGRFTTKWGDDPRIGSHGIALFGMDLHSIPFWHGRIVDYEIMKHAYAQLWHEILVDARLLHLHIANILLYRVMKGEDPPDDDGDLYDTDGEDETGNRSDVHVDCLESQVLAAPHYDVVGIAAKALATRFAMEFGKNAFPCLGHETEWVRKMLPDREPTVVPQRLINILRRGGYFDTQKTADLLWFTEGRTVREGFETDVVKIAVHHLEAAGCTDVDSENIVFISSPVADNVIAKDAVCRFNSVTEQFFVHQDFMSAPVDEFIGEKMVETDSTRIKGYLLGMYIAKAHPFGKVLARYLVRNNLS